MASRGFVFSIDQDIGQGDFPAPHSGCLVAHRKEVKAKGLAADDRRFYIEGCMNKT